MKNDNYGKFESLFFAVFLFSFIGYAAVWTQDVPKVQPDKAKYLLAKAEEAQRNCDPNSIEFKIAKQAAAKLNKYVLNFRCDVNKDGIIDHNDVDLVMANLGCNGNGIKMEELKCAGNSASDLL